MRFGGALGRENVGISNHNAGERPAHRKPKVSLAMFIIQGLVGPKDKPRGDSDGQTVNIPSPLLFFNGRTQGCSWSVLLDLHWWVEDVAQANPRRINPRSARSLIRQTTSMSTLPRKFPRAKLKATVPKTNTGGRGE